MIESHNGENIRFLDISQAYWKMSLDILAPRHSETGWSSSARSDSSLDRSDSQMKVKVLHGAVDGFFTFASIFTKPDT